MRSKRFLNHVPKVQMMTKSVFSYFPGCSLATTAKENNASLYRCAEELGVELVELEDWNCCGSSSAHSVDPLLADHLAMRNLYLAPPHRPLLIACPSCNLRLHQANIKLQTDPAMRAHYKKVFGRPAHRNLKILHVFELLDRIDWTDIGRRRHGSLKSLKCAPYYGCMLARPPAMNHMQNYHGLMERILAGLGATAVSWGYGARCCGTFLSVVRPDVVSAMVQKIVANAEDAGADCIVTACAMCHMNLEIRSITNNSLPIFHFSEILSLAFEHTDTDAYFSRHIIDPRPMLKRCGLIS